MISDVQVPTPDSNDEKEIIIVGDSTEGYNDTPLYDDTNRNNEIADVIKFKQEINETLDTYISSLKNSDILFDKRLKRLVEQTLSYYGRMKVIYSSKYEHDDEDDEDDDDENEDDVTSDIISDDSDDGEYAKLFEDRIYVNAAPRQEAPGPGGQFGHGGINRTNFSTRNLEQREEKIRSQLLGLNDLTYNEFDNLDDESTILGFDDSSVDNTYYDTPDHTDITENSVDEEDDDDHILHNTKYKFNNIELNAEIIISDENDGTDNYEEPDIKMV